MSKSNACCGTWAITPGRLTASGGGQSQQATIDFQRAYMEQKDVDGIFGAETEKRIREVVASGEKPKESVQIDIGDASYASVYLHFDSYHYATGVDV